MSENIFPQKEVGDYFNTRFISVSLQMDRTANDAEPVKKWYGDAAAIGEKYGITGYPTYLIFSPSGDALHRFSGGMQDSKEFIGKTSDGLDLTKQYYTLINHLKEHKGDSAFLRRLKGMQFEKGIKSEIRSEIYKDTTREPDFNAISKKFKSKYIGCDPVTEHLLLDQEAGYYAGKKQWSKCNQAAYLLMTRRGEEVGKHDMNNIAWYYVFLHSNDKVILAEATKWMKRVITMDPSDAGYVDTYANLHYKMGNKKEAIALENKAIEVGVKENSMPEDIKEFRSNLEKMQKGIKTWEE